jgi:hypothetical protein
MASSFDRGAQPSTRLAFALVAFLNLPSSGTISATDESNSETSRTIQSGSSSGRDARRRVAHARLQHQGDFLHGHEVAGDARNRSPLAAGLVMARRCKSATSRTSTMPKDRRGQPGIAPSIKRCTIWMEVE